MQFYQPESLFLFQSLGSAVRFVDEIHDITHHAPLFRGMSCQEIKAMCSFMNCYAAKRASVLVSEGERGGSLLIVLTGRVSILKRGADGRDVRIATALPGQTLGEMSLIDGRPRFATCITEGPVDYAVLTRAALDEILMVQPRLGNKILLLLLGVFTERLRHMVGFTLPHMSEHAV